MSQELKNHVSGPRQLTGCGYVSRWRRFDSACRAVVLACSLVGWLGCKGDDEGSPPSVGSNSNWFRPCVKDVECGGLACLCGACGAECSADADCSDLDDARCAAVASPATLSQCGDALSPTGLCLPRCEPGQCEPSQACADGACVALQLPDVPFCAPAESPERSAREREDALLALVQELRTGGGEPCGGTAVSPAPALRLDPRLTCVARKRALDVELVGSFQRTDSEGRTTEERLAEVSYQAMIWGEAFAIAASSAEEALAFMREDFDSCRRLSDPAFADIGIGVASDVAVIVIGVE